MQVQHSYTSSTDCWTFRTHVLTLPAKEIRSNVQTYWDSNRLSEHTTFYLLDHSGDELELCYLVIFWLISVVRLFFLERYYSNIVWGYLVPTYLMIQQVVHYLYVWLSDSIWKKMKHYLQLNLRMVDDCRDRSLETNAKAYPTHWPLNVSRRNFSPTNSRMTRVGLSYYCLVQTCSILVCWGLCLLVLSQFSDSRRDECGTQTIFCNDRKKRRRWSRDDVTTGGCHDSSYFFLYR